MKIEYYIKKHLGSDRMYVKDTQQRMWLMKLTKRATITPQHATALQSMGIKLVEVKPPRK